MSKQVMERALDALESWMNLAIDLSSSDNSCNPPIDLDADDLAVIAALKEAIKQAGDPVGETCALAGSNGGFTMAAFDAKTVPVGTKLYTYATIIPEGWREFVERVSKQKPEKPDYWSTCMQCERNISDAEDLIDAYQGDKP